MYDFEEYCNTERYCDIPATGCDKERCPMNDGCICTSPIGCMYYEADFLNSNTVETGEVINDTFKSFIRKTE